MHSYSHQPGQGLCFLNLIRQLQCTFRYPKPNPPFDESKRVAKHTYLLHGVGTWTVNCHVKTSASEMTLRDTLRNVVRRRRRAWGTLCLSGWCTRKTDNKTTLATIKQTDMKTHSVHGDPFFVDHYVEVLFYIRSLKCDGNVNLMSIKISL